jgi:hypothetical protein
VYSQSNLRPYYPRGEGQGSSQPIPHQLQFCVSDCLLMKSPSALGAH